MKNKDIPRFALKEDCDWWGITDNQLPKTKTSFREDLSKPYLSCDYKYNDLTHQEVVDLLNKLNDENEHLKEIMGIMPNDNIGEVVNVFNCQEMEKWKFRRENEQLRSEYKVLHTQYQDLRKFVENNFDEYLTQEKLNIQIINLSDKNEQLKEALLFFLAIALTDSSIDYQNDADKWCNILFNCDYEEAKRRYGDFKHEERWDLE